MRKISDTIARLAALKAQASFPGDDASSGRLSPLVTVASNPGALKSWCYVPDDLPDNAPLVVVLHGCTQTAAGYDHHSGWSRLADEAGVALLYPEQQRQNNANLCFNWFVPSDAERDSGEALSIRQMIEAMVAEHGLDRSRIFITGLSAGGAMAAAMLATYPEVFAAGAIIAGLPFASATTVPQAFDRMRGHGSPSEEILQRKLRGASAHRGSWPKISIWHGSADRTVVPANADAIAAQWRAVHQVDRAPAHTEVAGRLTRQVWTDTRGEAMIEINTVEGMGHGTPLGSDGLGVPGPFMLEVGISSTRQVARSWGIATAATHGSERRSSTAVGNKVLTTPLPEKPSSTAAAAPAPTALKLPGQLPRSKHESVRKIIEDALHAAGLMR